MPIAQRANRATRRRFYNAVPPFHAPMSKKSLKTIRQPDQFRHRIWERIGYLLCSRHRRADELALSVALNDRVNRRGRTNIVSGTRVLRRLVECELIKPHKFFPGQLIGGTPAHKEPKLLMAA